MNKVNKHGMLIEQNRIMRLRKKEHDMDLDNE
jgi:hypothetical protein